MSVQQIVDLYYDAWINKQGDMSGVPLAANFEFLGPVASLNCAEAYRACSIIDWEMALPVAPMTSAEILQVEDGELVRGELIYDAQELRAALAAAG